MVDIVILFEHPQRDLENALMLKCCFEEKGYLCDIIKYPFINPVRLKLIYRNKTKCVITHSLYSDRVIYNLVYSIFGKAEYIFNLQCEQIRTNNDENMVASYSWPKSYAKNAFHICWGERIVELLMNSGVKRERLLLTGPIQMDVWRESFKGFFIDRKELIDRFSLNPKYSIVLFISSFSYAHLSDIANRQMRLIQGDQEVTRFSNISRESQKIILEWFKVFLMNHKDFTLVYRKHPAEDINVEVFGELLSLNNFRIISELPINEWIYNADILLNWCSTSGVEAYIAKKQSILLRPVEIPYDEDISIFHNANKVENYDEFESAMMNTSDCGLDLNVIKKYYSIEEKPSYIRAADLIDSKIKTGNKFRWERNLLKKMNKKYRQQNMMFVPVLIYSYIIDALRRGQDRFGFKIPDSILNRINRRRLELKRQKADEKEIRFIGNNKVEYIYRNIHNEYLQKRKPQNDFKCI